MLPTLPLLNISGHVGVLPLLLWIWLLIVVFSDIFRTMTGGFAKAIWCSSVISVLGVLIYLIARGGACTSGRAAAARQQKAFDTYVKQAAGGQSDVDALSKLADLKSRASSPMRSSSPEGKLLS